MTAGSLHAASPIWSSADDQNLSSGLHERPLRQMRSQIADFRIGIVKKRVKEALAMALGALLRVGAGAGVEDLEGPVARLQREQLAQRPFAHRWRADRPQLGGPLGPGELAVPRAQVAALAPARGRDV